MKIRIVIILPSTALTRFCHLGCGTLIALSDIAIADNIVK